MARQTNPPPSISSINSSLKTVICAWLLAGTLDITAAATYYPLTYHITVTDLLQGIASGVFGDKAFSGGMQMAVLGLTFHYLIALIWTVFFFLVFPKMKVLSRNRFITGLAYGIFVWLVMNLIVLPLSNAEHLPLNITHALVGAIFLMFCIGLPISMIIGRYYSRY